MYIFIVYCNIGMNGQVNHFFFAGSVIIDIKTVGSKYTRYFTPPPDWINFLVLTQDLLKTPVWYRYG